MYRVFLLPKMSSSLPPPRPRPPKKRSTTQTQPIQLTPKIIQAPIFLDCLLHVFCFFASNFHHVYHPTEVHRWHHWYDERSWWFLTPRTWRTSTTFDQNRRVEPGGRWADGRMSRGDGRRWLVFFFWKRKKRTFPEKRPLSFLVVFPENWLFNKLGRRHANFVPLMGDGWIMNFETTFGCVFNKILDLELECGMECYDMWRSSWVDYWPPPWRCLRIVFLSATWRNLIRSWIQQTCGWAANTWESQSVSLAVCLKNPLDVTRFTYWKSIAILLYFKKMTK